MPTTSQNPPIASNSSQSPSPRAVLDKLPDGMKRQIDDSLSNDENSSDEELVQFWCQECGIPEEAARAAIAHRTSFLLNPLFELFPQH